MNLLILSIISWPPLTPRFPAGKSYTIPLISAVAAYKKSFCRSMVI
jgi:hypothetical protein